LGESVLGTSDGREEEAKVRIFRNEKIATAASARERPANEIQAEYLENFTRTPPHNAEIQLRPAQTVPIICP
jgi:hypothetical protein